VGSGRGPIPRRITVPHTLDLIVQPRLAPRQSLAVDRFLLAEAAAGKGGALRVYDLAGDILSLGRYHLAPTPRPGATAAVMRRHSGGRAMPWGDGFVGISLVLPHRSALVSEEPLALAPAQVMNRYVRGVLEACKIAGVSAFYPGRDLITYEGRLLGMASFEVAPGGALLFEAVLAVTRDASVLPTLVDAVDPEGVVAAGMLAADDTTSLARVLGRALATDELAELMRGGYAERLDVRFVDRILGATDERSLATIVGDVADERWLRARVRCPELDRHGSIATQLGVLEAHFALDGGRLREVVLAGDVIASSSTIEALAAALRGCPAEAEAIDRVVMQVLADPHLFVLGVGPARTITDAIVRGLPG
jgi:lipoate-protein ligase A